MTAAHAIARAILATRPARPHLEPGARYETRSGVPLTCEAVTEQGAILRNELGIRRTWPAEASARLRRVDE